MHFFRAELDDLVTARNFLPDVLLAVERVTALVDVAELHAFADLEFAAVRLFGAGNHSKQRGLARSVRSDHADDAAGRQLEVEILDQELIAEAFGEAFG